MNDLYIRALKSGIFGLIALTALVFLPAGTLDYWQGWEFAAVFVGSTVGLTVYLARHDPKLLERRLSAGPQAEREPTQRIIMLLAMLGFAALPVFSALDWRFHWSPVPWWVSLAGDALIALGYLGILFVFRENSFGASTIQVVEGQKVISTGPYSVVRHPMYASALVMLAGIPLALGSWWGLFAILPMVPVLIWRLLDEEMLLREELPGYTAYSRQVHYRLVPFVW
jgi:protein-S-isoprenylcysteine O-methyltransferase Ste14